MCLYRKKYNVAGENFFILEDSQINVLIATEVVVDEESVRKAMKQGIKAACTIPGIKEINAGNYGGNLGAYKINLRDLF